MIHDSTLASLRRWASKHSRVAHEIDDLVQDVLLSAVVNGMRITDPGFLAWAKGAIRNHARFVARTAARRRTRETAWEAVDRAPAPQPCFSPTFIAILPPAQRIVALLVNLGMGRDEIAHLLGLSEAALRQRLSGLRRALGAFGDEATAFGGLPPLVRGDGLARRALKRVLAFPASRAFGIRDPDGVPIFFSRHDHVPPDGGN